jgi:protein-disulfide isomerase
MIRYLTLFALALFTLAPVAMHAQTRRPQPARTVPARPPAAAQKTPPAATPTPNNTAAQAKADEDCACDAGALPGLLATVNGIRITSADVSAETEAQVRDLEQQLAAARKSELDRQINTRLLEAEAKRRGIPTEKLITEEIDAKATVSDDEARAFYEQNKQQLFAADGAAGAQQFKPFETVKQDIVENLKAQREQELLEMLAARLRVGANYQVLVTELPPATTPAARARVVATVNGQQITAGDVETNVLPLRAQVQQAAYDLRKRDLDLRINDTLLQQEAQRRKVTPEALLDTELKTRFKPVTEADAQAFFQQNRASINGDYPAIKDQLITYMNDQRRTQATGALATELRRAATIQTFLVAPVMPALTIATDDQPTRGLQTAKVTIVEFTDFQCPSCAATFPVLERIMTEYGDRVRLVVRDFPLSQHKNAHRAAEAAEAARAQGKYWEYAALLFKNQSAATTDETKAATLDVAKLKEYATQVGLNRQQFDAALDAGRFAPQVERDRNDGLKLGVNHTPSIFINGRLTQDNAYETLKAALDAALQPGAK